MKEQGHTNRHDKDSYTPVSFPYPLQAEVGERDVTGLDVPPSEQDDIEL